QVEPDHIGRFLVKLRIVTGHIPAHPVRLQPGFGPRSRHSHMTDSQFLCQFARAPMGRAVLGQASRAVQYLRLQCRTLGLNLPPWMPSVESAQAFGFITFSPKPHGIDATAHLPGHGSLRLTFGQPQNDIGASDILGGKTAATQRGLQFGLVSGTHFKRNCHGQNHSKQAYQKSMLQCTSGCGYGGGLFNLSGTVILDSCTISSNIVDRGYYHDYGTEVATGDADGGALYNLAF